MKRKVIKYLSVGVISGIMLTLGSCGSDNALETSKSYMSEITQSSTDETSSQDENSSGVSEEMAEKTELELALEIDKVGDRIKRLQELRQADGTNIDILLALIHSNLEKSGFTISTSEGETLQDLKTLITEKEGSLGGKYSMVYGYVGYGDYHIDLKELSHYIEIYDSNDRVVFYRNVDTNGNYYDTIYQYNQDGWPLSGSSGDLDYIYDEQGHFSGHNYGLTLKYDGDSVTSYVDSNDLCEWHFTYNKDGYLTSAKYTYGMEEDGSPSVKENYKYGGKKKAVIALKYVDSDLGKDAAGHYRIFFNGGRRFYGLYITDEETGEKQYLAGSDVLLVNHENLNGYFDLVIPENAVYNEYQLPYYYFADKRGETCYVSETKELGDGFILYILYSYSDLSKGMISNVNIESYNLYHFGN